MSKHLERRWARQRESLLADIELFNRLQTEDTPEAAAVRDLLLTRICTDARSMTRTAHWLDK